MDEEQFIRELTRQFLDHLDSHTRHMTEALRESWRDVEEWTPFLQSGTLNQAAPQGENPVEITAICAYAGVATPANMGLIELGAQRQPIPIPGGQLISLTGLWRLQSTDVRIISSVTNTGNAPGARGSGAAGFLYMGLFGKEIPLGRVRW